MSLFNIVWLYLVVVYTYSVFPNLEGFINPFVVCKHVQAPCVSIHFKCCVFSVSAVSNYSHVLEGQSDSDDEDKLHIVEEEGSLLDGADCDSVAPDDDPNGAADPDGRWDDGKPASLRHAVIKNSLYIESHFGFI